MTDTAVGLDAVKQWCTANEFSYQEGASEHQIMIVQDPKHEVPIHVVGFDDRDLLTFAMFLPMIIPELRLNSVRLAISALNSDTFLGAWALKPETGEVFFRVTLPTLGFSMGEGALDFLFGILVGTVSSSADGLHQVAQGADWQSVLES